VNSPNWISFRLELDEIAWIKQVQALLKKHKGLDLSLSKTCRYLIKRGGEAECRSLERFIDKQQAAPVTTPEDNMKGDKNDDRPGA